MAAAKEAAKVLREEAERTAGTIDLGQRDWDGFENLARGLIKAAKAAKADNDRLRGLLHRWRVWREGQDQLYAETLWETLDGEKG